MRAFGGVTYAYDGNNRRVRMTSGTQVTHYLHDASGALVAEYSNVPGTFGTDYLFGDHLGSTRLVVSDTGQVKATDYAPFGELLVNQNGRTTASGYAAPAPVRQMFTGKERDETGLDYSLARYYGAYAGRFTSADAPFADQKAKDPLSWNLYGYVRSSPLIYLDPKGRNCEQLLAGNVGAAGACKDYFVGGLKALANLPTDALNTPNALANIFLAPFTDVRIPELTKPNQPANNDEALGMQALEQTLLAVPVAEAVTATLASRVANITTPHGVARQASTAEALAARSTVESGATLYRIGTTGVSNTVGAQYWSLENPLSSGYASRYGVPAANIANANFIETATLRPGASFVTRPAPGVGSNRGGGIEVVTNPGGVRLKAHVTIR